MLILSTTNFDHLIINHVSKTKERRIFQKVWILVIFKANLLLWYFNNAGFLPEIFSGIGGKSIVMQFSFVLLIFLLFSNQISGWQKSLRGENCLRGRPLRPLPPRLWKEASNVNINSILRYNRNELSILPVLLF